MKINALVIKKAIEENNFFTTFNMNDELQLDLLANAMSGESISLNDVPDITFNCIGVYITDSSINEGSYRTVLVADDGKCYSGNGRSTFDAVSGFLMIYSKEGEQFPTEKNPLPLHVKIKSTLAKSTNKYPVLSVCRK